MDEVRVRDGMNGQYAETKHLCLSIWVPISAMIQPWYHNTRPTNLSIVQPSYHILYGSAKYLMSYQKHTTDFEYIQQ
jgi:hypothetical protein